MAWTLRSTGVSLLTAIALLGTIAPQAEPREEPARPDPRVAAALSFGTPLATFGLGAALIHAASSGALAEPNPAFMALIGGGVIAFASPLTAVAGHRYARVPVAANLATLLVALPVASVAVAAITSPSTEALKANLVPAYLMGVTVGGVVAGWHAWHASESALIRSSGLREQTQGERAPEE